MKHVNTVFKERANTETLETLSKRGTLYKFIRSIYRLSKNRLQDRNNSQKSRETVKLQGVEILYEARIDTLFEREQEFYKSMRCGHCLKKQSSCTQCFKEQEN
jgi:hypothetical protein